MEPGRRVVSLCRVELEHHRLLADQERQTCEEVHLKHLLFQVIDDVNWVLGWARALFWN